MIKIRFTGKLPIIALLLIQCSVVFGREFPKDKGMFPFVISLCDRSSSIATDLSGLLDAPAGKYGFVRVEGDHFATDKGIIRFNATNLTAGANFPTHEHAERLARRLARFGINCVRLHYMDHSYGPVFFGMPSEPGIFANDGSDRNFDSVLLDRLDYLISKFKENGIYVNVNLHVDRGYKLFNEVNPTYQEKEKEYAKDLLTHINPYTGMSLAEDPCVAQIELDNEDSLFSHYSGGSFLLNGWPKREQLRDSLSYEDKVAFLNKLEKIEKDHWKSLYDYLKNEIGIKVPITSTQTAYSYPWTLTDMDYYDNHAYWCHPSLGIHWSIDNLPMVNNPDGGSLTRLARRHLAGKPYTISEINNPYPIFYGAEGQPMIHAFAAFQGWDGVFAYSWCNRQNTEPEMVDYFFSYAARTDAIAHFISCSAMFLRGDVKTSENCLELPVSRDEYQKEWLKHCNTPFPTPENVISRLTDGNIKAGSSLLHRTSIRMDPEKIEKFQKDSIGTTKVSDTGEIEWNQDDPKKGIFIVRTENSKFFTGFPDGRTIDLGSGIKLKVGKTKLGWATISLTSIKANGFESGSTTLLAATGFTHNSGARFSSVKDKDGNPTSRIYCRDQDWGQAPVITEGINACIDLPSSLSSENAECWALDEKGERKSEVRIRKRKDNSSFIEISEKYQTIWYEISVR